MKHIEGEPIVEQKEKRSFFRPLVEKIKGSLPWIGAATLGATFGLLLEPSISNWFGGLDDSTKTYLPIALILIGSLAGLSALEKDKFLEYDQINRENFNQAKAFFHH